ncbi:uncharacterized protein B0H64DRAFT_227428 [Chaetomium fimeti]|uniref:Uncharacterized protein n=1 Tax=Chaetomium fimeti TaxID=1854472 RepID=A0AAE0H9V8_9PEZI|nr:hypothetical protein B0H64DRAFT_227428 [Chaetomium fimeti]
MNRFRTKKRAKDDLAAGRSSEDSEQSSLSFFRKGKKAQQEEVKQEIDLSKALPTNDDFRTSLLMNNLSARFSMLREQDDPSTKIGKASDDSVLYTKRQSRLADFGFGAGGLSDIAEVESVRGPNLLRTTSVASDDPDSANGGSVLARSRPTEGNVLFGGRQKIYKIPAASGGGMSGRAVYEEDVAMSAFQKWRQTERDRTLDGLNGTRSDEAEEEPHTRSESPPLMSYRRKRETASTTSSNSIMARNSTAATSVTSQAAGAIKDWQPAPSVSSSAVASPIPERNVTRTRRLYEQGFNQESNEHQGSVLSRIEALTRPRPFGTKATDTPPQTDGTRTILTKTSAPSLRSLSPASTSRPIGALDLGNRVKADSKPSNLGGLPPLSPPVSETGEQPILSKDVGNATATGIFQKSSQPYDESQYVQRQLQLQQGRETPTQRHRAESNGRNTPVSGDHETKPAAIGARPPPPNAALPPTPIAEAEPSQATAVNPAGLTVPGESHIERPSDEDHPAFRQSALPTPLAVGAKPSREPSPILKKAVPVTNSQKPSPTDSPTLGPASGLSGLVRQHLRTESVESTLGDTGFDASAAGSRYNLDAKSPSLLSEPGPALSPWPSSDQDWLGSHSGNGAETTPGGSEGESQSNRENSDSRTVDRASTATEDETDGFANQLANARRRVREKLTSYVESDSSRATSPLLLPTDPPSLSTQTPNPLGIVKPKSSRGSLMDRSRNTVTGQSKGLKILGLGSATMSTSPQPSKQSFEEKEFPFPSLETMKEEAPRDNVPQRGHKISDAESYTESDPAKDNDEDGNTHPGLRAFRQARRDLQKRKELETLARHQASQTSQSPDEAPEQRNGMHSAAARVPRQRTPSRERRPPPVTYKQRAPSDDQSYSSPGAMRPSGERSRSGSETSGGRSNSRPPRLRTNTNNGPHDQLGAPNPGRPMMRSPGLPGTDIKNSPVMPPYPYPSRGAPSPSQSPHPDRSRSAANLALHTGRPGLDPHSGQPSPISPMGLPSPSPYTMGLPASPIGTPTSFGPRPRLPSASQSPALGPVNGAMPHQMRRPVDKREISEPTFVMSTSRVPTTTLPHHPPQHPAHSQYPPPPSQPPPMVPGRGPRSRSNSRAAGPAPPLPPINPRRRREDSRPRAPHEDNETAAPRLPHADNGTSWIDIGAGSEDEGGDKSDQRRRLRKPHPDMQAAPSSRPFPGRSRESSPPLMANGPAASRSAANHGNGNGMGVPGGMI